MPRIQWSEPEPQDRELQIFSSLNANPVYRISLGSQELFHSNFIEWLLTTRLDAFRSIFGIEMGEFVSHREKHHIDLLLIDKKNQHIVAIENKVKDIPRRSQLNQYSKTLVEEYGSAKIDKFVMSLADIGEVEIDGWSIISYALISQRIRTLIQGDNTFIEQLLYHYAEMIDLLATIVRYGQELKRESTYWFDREGDSELESFDRETERIGFSETLKKLSAAQLLRDVELKLGNSNSLVNIPRSQRLSGEKDQKKEACFRFMKSDLTNKTPLVEASLSRYIRGRHLRLGVQIQGKQYRRFVEWGGLNVKSVEDDRSGVIEAFVQKTDRNRWLFTTSNKNVQGSNGYFKSGMQFATSMRHADSYGSYAPGFVYRYLDISSTETGKLRPSEIPDAVVADLEFAKTLITDESYCGQFASAP